MNSQPSAAKTEPTVIGIGASAGGLAALKTLLSQVPDDCGLAFVVVVHLSPDHESHLAELLQPQIHFPVLQVVETVPLEANHVYVIPPNANLNAIDTHLRLSELEERRQERAPIDHFFRTLAKAHDGRSIAVVLTGTGSDGTLGIKDVKAHGGMVIVQDPNEAEYDGMPQSAIATGMADFILPVAEIPGAILRFDGTKPRVPEVVDGETVPQHENLLLQNILAHLRTRTDRDFSRYKPATVLRRISRRMQLNHIEDMRAYVQLLRDRLDEARALADDLLITVTHFFRDPEVFEKLEKDIIPPLFHKKSPSDVVRAWSVGCATGEEAYSLAVVLAEAAAKLEAPPQIQVFASDLHARSLTRAREGLYPGDIEADVSPERLKEFFRQENGGYRIRKEIRDLIVFSPHNILADPPFSRMDLISCRNLLIYLERDVQREVVEIFNYGLNAEGVLLLGSAESIENPELFRTLDKRLCFFVKRNAPHRELRLPVFPTTGRRWPAEEKKRGNQPADSMAVGDVHQRMIEQYAPPSILVGPDNTLLHLSRHAGRYMAIPGGEPTKNALKLVREELQLDLQASLHEAREEREAVDVRPILVRFDGNPSPVVMHLRPSLEPEREGFVLVIFEERAPYRGARISGDPAQPYAERMEDLEAQLASARRQTQSVMEEFESTRERMSVSSEEMQSTNEELRSTLEELETSKEELQSINEELQTVNQQNRHKVEELAQLSGDLQNLLSATDIATLFLDRKLRIMRFTPKLGDLFNIRITDQGRPIADLTNRLGYPELASDTEAVLNRLVPMEREVTDESGRWYLTRVLPYRSADDRIEGIVITFIDISDRKEAERAVLAAKYYAESIIETLHEPLLVLTPDLAVRSANPAFYRHFKVQPAATIGRRIYELGNRQWDIPALRMLLENVLPENHTFENFEVEHAFEAIGPRNILVNARRLDEVQLILLGIHDITETRRAEKELQASDRELRRANTDLQHFSFAVSHDLQESLRTVVIYTERLLRNHGAALNEDARQCLDHALRGASRLQSMFEQLRAYWSVSEQMHQELAPVDCNVALNLALGYLEPLLTESDAKITSDPLPTVVANLYSLTLLFQNLISNAVKYKSPDTSPEIHVSAERQASRWMISVADNGIGIDSKYFESIFAPFKRLHTGKSAGTGLGLAMCRRIVERYNGEIIVNSAEGSGSTFQFTIPDAGSDI